MSAKRSSVHDQPPDVRASRGEATRAQIRQAARQLLADEGLAGMSTRAVAERAGVQLSLVHYHFGGKQALLMDLLKRENTELVRRQAKVFNEAESLSELWRMVCDLFRGDLSSGYTRILWELWAAGLADETLAGEWLGAENSWHELIRSAIDHWRAKGTPVGAPPTVLATLVTTIFAGMEADALLRGEVSPENAAALDFAGEMIEAAESAGMGR